MIDSKSNAPLFYVNVGLLNQTDSTTVSVTTTDKDGIYKFQNIKSGNYILKTSYIGYEMYQQSISVSGIEKEMTIETILLRLSATMLHDVTVTTTKPVYMNDGEKTLYNVSEDPSIQTGTASDALQNAPGVEVDIEGNIKLRGVSSVAIWINGRPSKLNPENLKTYLQQLPANSLERIEVINNPSARYSANGADGIINIVTLSNIKKNNFLSFGLNGSTRPMFTPWISYMYSNEKFSINIYANGYYNRYKYNENGYSIILNDTFDTTSYRNYTNSYSNHYLALGTYFNASYKIDSLKTITFTCGMWGSPFEKNKNDKNYLYREYIENQGVYDYSENVQGYEYYLGGDFGIEYEHNFNDDGHTLTAEISADIWKTNEKGYYQRSFQYYPDLKRNYKTLNTEKDYSFSASIDYALPYNEDGVIEIGVSGDLSIEDYFWKTDTLSYINSEMYDLDSLRFQIHKGKNSDFDAYVTVEHEFGNFKIKGGLRTQYRYFDFQTINQPECDGKKDYFGLFPSLHLSYATKKMHNFSLSYTRKVRYPWGGQLDTFKKYSEDGYETGNPNLRPTFTNSVEAGWTKYFDKFGSVGLNAYFRNNKDERNGFTDVVYSEVFQRYVTYFSYINSGKSRQYGSDLNVTYKVKAFMNIRLKAGIYQYHNETLFRNQDTVITNNLGYNFQINFWAKLWKFLEINASGYYRSKSKSVYSEYEPTYAINCGLRSDFWNKKISVFLNVQDIFNWGRQRNANTNPYYIAYSSKKYNSRFISAGVTFRFGKIEMESKARTGGNTE
jgi:outer membrane receptor protein involved in Fe transport